MRLLLAIDRRFIFLVVLVAVIAGTLFPERLQLPIKTSKPVRGVFDAVERLEAGAPIMVAMDFDPSSAPELEPQARAVLRQSFRKGLHAIGMTHWNTGLALTEQIMKESAMEFDDVELEAVPVASKGEGEAALAAIGSAASPEEGLAVLRYIAYGNEAERERLLAPFAAKSWLENLAGSFGKLTGSGGAEADKRGAVQAIVEAAKRIPEEALLKRRKVNFAKDKLVYDQEWKARDLLWHLKAGDLAAEPVPIVDAERKVTGYELVRVAGRTSTLSYGKDWCFLGYKAGAAVLMISMGQNLYAAFPTDKYNTPTRDLPILQNVGSLSDLKYLVELAAGNTGEQWIVYGSERYGFAMGIGCTAVIAPDLYPYYGSHQITGIAGGIKGAWEYETLVGVPDQATAQAPVQTVAHLLVIALIVFCNLAYFAQRFTRRAAS
jgi:hypothetical protein